MTAADDKALFDGVYAGRRVLVTGETGFKGSWLASWLLDLGAEVVGYALDPPTDPSLFEALRLSERIDHHSADIRDLPSLRSVMDETRPEIVFHLAAQPLVRLSYEEPVETFETNVMGSVNVLEAAREAASVRAVLNVTSDKCYENREWSRPYSEADAMGGFDPYSASKAAAEIVTGAYRRSFFAEPGSSAVATARAGNVIGGGDWACDRIVPDSVRALAAGTPIVVRNPGAVRPWQHVLESTSGYLWLAAKLFAEGSAFTGAWNFGPSEGTDLPVSEVVGMVISEWGSGTWETTEGSRSAPHEARLLKLDCSKAAQGLGWHTVYTFEGAIRDTARWYRGYYEDPAAARRLTEASLSAYIRAAREADLGWARA